MKITLLLSIFLFMCVRNYAQEFTVFYNEVRKANYRQLRSSMLDIIPRTEDDMSLIRDKAKDHSNELKRYEYNSVLRIDGSKSIYYPIERQYNDTINNSVTYGKGGKRVFISRETSEKEYKVVYINKRKKKKSSVEYAYGKEYLIEEKLSKLNWKKTNETKKMFGYTCKKALLFKSLKKEFTGSYGVYTTKNQKPVEVWYTEDIDSSFGPAGYWGLPGLIVKVVEDDAVIVIDRILYTLDGFKVKPPNTGEKITREELEDIPMLLFNEH
ncbi:GLPGLI family protein [Aquimarina sp. MMG015]|uniref:GLPGLI family protein n=1 Tax=Aquimarina sp. MMG015 TaxID=2822689 RepID=UPI001B3A420A|nr:GLPGLI family protein [Aquimarina sp. MMG015]MBQ4804230.1 GLPGLI family protein [Aquimarina sp. MMG015]